MWEREGDERGIKVVEERVSVDSIPMMSWKRVSSPR